MYQSNLFLGAILVNVLGQMGMLEKLAKKLRYSLIIAMVNVIILTAVIANFLAVLGIFSINNITISLFSLGLTVTIVFRKEYKNIKIEYKSMTIFAFLISILGLFLIYSMYTIVPLGIGRDPSVYFYEGIYIAQKGSIYFEGDSFVAENYEQLKSLIDIKGAGLYSAYEFGLSNTPGDVVIQFLHMFPSILAVGYSLFEVRGMQLVNPIIAVACATLIFTYIRDILDDKRAAWIAFILCALNPAQIYSARITQSELLCQLIFLLSVYYFAIGWKRNSSLIISLSGALVGLMTFNRMDMYILGVGVFVLALYHIWMRPENIKKVLCYSLSYTGVGIIALIYGWCFSYPYYKDHWDAGVLAAILVCNLVLILSVTISIVVRSTNMKKVKIPDIVECFSEKKWSLLLVGSLAIIALFAYFVRPVLSIYKGIDSGAQFFKANALVEFCFYTSFFAIPLALHGIYRLLRNVSIEKIHSFLPLAFMGMSNLAIYIYSPSIANDQIWASRRWVTVCIPFVLMLTGVGISRIQFKKCKNFLQVTTSLIIVLFMLYQSRGFLLENIGGDIWEDYKQYSEQIAEEELYFSNNKFVVTILREIFEKKNVYLAGEAFEQNVENYIEKNGGVCYIGNVSGEILNNKDICVKKIIDYTFNSNELERTKGKMPERIITRNIPVEIYYLQSGYAVDKKSIYSKERSRADVFDLSVFSSQNKDAKKKGIVSNGASGFILYGFYDTVDRGTYRVDIDFTLKNNEMKEGLEIGCVEVVGEKQKVLSLEPVDVDSNGYATVSFSVRKKTTPIEYRFYLKEGIVAEITGVSRMQISDCFSPGLDDAKAVKRIGQILDNDLANVQTIACFDSSEVNELLLDGIRKHIPESVNIVKYTGVDKEVNKPDALLAYVYDTEWWSLLSQYRVISREGDYLLFCRNEIRYEKECLSKELYINASILYREEKGMNISGELLPIQKGHYKVRIQLEKKSTDVPQTAYVLNERMVIARMDLAENQDTVLIDFDARNVLNNLRIEVYSQQGNRMDVNAVWLKKVTSEDALLAEVNLEPLVEILTAKIGWVTEIGFFDIRSRISMLNTNTILEVLKPKVVVDIYEQDDIVKAKKLDVIIVAKQLQRENFLLENEYIVVGETNEYALFVTSNLDKYFDKSEILSNGKYLAPSYFLNENYNYRVKGQNTLEKGKYEIVVEVKLPNVVSEEILKQSMIQIVSLNKVIVEVPLLPEGMLYENNEIIRKVFVSSETNMEDTRVRIASLGNVGLITSRIVKMRRLDSNIYISLDKLFLDKGFLTNKGILFEKVQEGIIYGPYIDLEFGNYKAKFICESKNNQTIHFDIAANRGQEILAYFDLTAESLNNSEYEIELPFIVDEEAKELEFRVFLQGEDKFLLKELYILKE